MSKYKCDTCEDDGYIEVIDPEHYGAVIGIAPCPRGCQVDPALVREMVGEQNEDYDQYDHV